MIKKKISKILLFIFAFFIILPQVSAATVSVACDLGDIPRALPTFISNIVKAIKIFVPILLVIMGMLDFVRATISNDEKQMKESQSRFIRRLLAGGIIFFVVAIVQFVFSSIDKENKYSIISCINCFIDNKCVTSFEQGKCFQCNGIPDKYVWVNENPGITDSCPGGYHQLYVSEKECKELILPKKCYQCRSPQDIYKWDSDGQYDSKCPAGYDVREDLDTEEKCLLTDETWACYQCKGDSSIRSWTINGGADAQCDDGYSIISGITTEEECHS